MVRKQEIDITVAYANPQKQECISLKIPRGSTILQAIEQSGILQLFPEIDLTQNKIGIFSQPKNLSDFVHPGDRVEIYRPLLIDPKDARKARALKTNKK
jgi:putative ubiquitin-RnfH superfamily antitoxin RatB of RatAB toxin-antitoxin module